MNFFDIQPDSIPNCQDAQYYFNIVVRILTVNACLIEDQSIDSICYTEHITDARPYVLYIIVSEDEEELDGQDYIIEEYTHCVVEICGDQVCWYNMLDFKPPTRWRIDAEYEIELEEDEE